MTALTTVQFGAGRSSTQAALADLRDGLRKWRLWMNLGWLDVKQRYRRAVLGPFWITISMLVLVVALGVLYAGIFRQEIRSFLPYLAAGFIVWSFISTTITDGTITFVQAEGLLKQGGIPLTLHIFRTIFRNFVIGAHNLTVMLLMYLWQPSLLSWHLLLLIPGLILMTANLIWISAIVGTLCTRFRDLPPIVANLLQIFVFISPIMYKPTSVPPNLEFVIHLNPFYYFIDVVRSPLLGAAPSPTSYAVLVALAVAGSATAFYLFQRTRARVAYWV
ncbi:ABC transporter permease [Microbacteriaceae bacterium K1510]|nr:ABC transporter permease [Microbacteriaceae bacterium K1510]